MSADSAPLPETLPIIARALPDLAAWAECFDLHSLPVLHSSADGIEALRLNEEAVDAHLLAQTLAHDPLVTLKVFGQLASLRRESGREGTEAETLTAALVMLGISPFFRHFGPQTTVEAHLQHLPDAREGFREVFERSHRAARFALAFAVQRMDHDAAIVHEAALLHDFAELLIWVRAPALALEMRRRQQDDPQLRSSAVQRAVLNVELQDLQHRLMQRWGVPSHVVNLADDQRSNVSAQSRTVVLAIRLARHTAEGWDNPALGDDVQDIAGLLNMAPAPTLALLRDLDGQ